MSITITWDGSFENVPIATEGLSQGDNRIRDLKDAIRERTEKEHYWDLTGTQARHGEHLNGSAITYYGAVAPTQQPDSATALGANDNGRLWLDTSDNTLLVWVTSAWVDVTVAAALTAILANASTEVVNQGTGNNLRCKVIEIGDWNMLTTTSIGVTHGLTKDDIRSVTALIRNDADTENYMLTYIDNAASPASANGVGVLTSTINLVRALAGKFNSTSYDSTSYNRGWVTIWYEV